jgi:hypothetical protein
VERVERHHEHRVREAVRRRPEEIELILFDRATKKTRTVVTVT